MCVEIEQLDIFGLGRMWHQGQPLRECLTDQARFDAGDRMETPIRLPAPGCKHGGAYIDVADDAAGRWWAGFGWSLYVMPDGVPCGSHTPIDACRAATREDAIRMAARGLVESLPDITTGKAGRIITGWRRELAALTGAPSDA